METVSPTRSLRFTAVVCGSSVLRQRWFTAAVFCGGGGLRQLHVDGGFVYEGELRASGRAA